jgi:hypothetical protein
MNEANSIAEGGRFDWSDPFFLESQLSDDENLIRESARDFAQGALLPRVADAYLKESIDAAIFREYGSIGLLGITILSITAAAVRPMSPTGWWPGKSSAWTPVIAP